MSDVLTFCYWSLVSASGIDEPGALIVLAMFAMLVAVLTVAAVMATTSPPDRPYCPVCGCTGWHWKGCPNDEASE
tara:strand:- start:189 stop:413 length:225 start_codon:yes stop_codon:yes gene_type:complete